MSLRLSLLKKVNFSSFFHCEFHVDKEEMYISHSENDENADFTQMGLFM